MAAPDLSQLSDEDLKAVAAGDMSKVSDEGLKHLAGGGGTPTPAPKPQEPTGILTRVGHAIQDTGATIARGAGAVEDFAQNAAAALPGTKATPVDYGSPESHAYQYSHAPAFQHEPDVDVPNTDPKEAARQAFQQAHPGVRNAIDEFTAAHPAVGAAGDVLQGALATEGVRSGISSGVEAVTAPKPGAIPPVATRLQQAGFEMNPSDLERLNPAAAARGDIPGTVTQKINPPDVRQTQLKNAANVNRLAAEGNNLPNAEHISPQDLDAAAGQNPDGSIATTRPNQQGVQTETPLSVYRRAANAVPPGSRASANLGRDLDSVASGTKASDPNMQQQIAGMVDRYKQKYQPGVEGQGMLDDISTLRRRAQTDLQSDNLDFNDRGMAARGIADALEAEMARHFPPNSSLAGDFAGARQSLAQINDLRTALKGGSIDPAIMARIRASGGHLTGNNALIADAGEFLPGSVVHPNAIAAPSGGSLVSTVKNLPSKLVGNATSKATKAAGRGSVDEAAAEPLKMEAPPGNAGRTPAQGNLDLPDQYRLEPPEGTAPAARGPQQSQMNLKGENPGLYALEPPEGGNPVIEPHQYPLAPLSRAEWEKLARSKVKK